MKKKCVGAVCLCLVMAIGLFFTGCADPSMDVSFVRFSMGPRQQDYYLDFTIRFENHTKHAETILATDFTVEINGEKKESTFLYEYEDVFWPFPKIESQETVNLRVRVVSEMKIADNNTILVQYRGKTVAEDTIYVGKPTKANLRQCAYR